jgi:hypothetical protein
MEEYGYMCKTEYDYELLNAKGGSIIYPSLKDLKENKECVLKGCGIVAVKVELVKVLKENEYTIEDM